MVGSRRKMAMSFGRKVSVTTGLVGYAGKVRTVARRQ